MFSGGKKRRIIGLEPPLARRNGYVVPGETTRFAKDSGVMDDNPNRGDEISEIAALRAEIERLKTELIRAEWKIAESEARAEIDPLVGILNRRGFERELARSLAYVKRYGAAAALLYIDLDGFKAINDCYGHGAGDVLLKAVAAGLAAHVRSSDLVARIGGDEFGVLMWNADEARALAKAGELETVVAQLRARHGEVELSVGASAGAAPLDPEADVVAIIEAADRAMYARKTARKG